MACLEMYNNSQTPPMSPRISFSNDFVESHNNSYTSKRTELPPASSDFEFSVTNFNTLTTADELFFKGRLLPSKDINASLIQKTLRDEINNDDEESDVDFSLKPPKGTSTSNRSRWKGLLGLRKSQIGSKKTDKLDVSTFDSGKGFCFSLEDPNLTKSSQEMVSSEASDMEMGI